MKAKCTYKIFLIVGKAFHSSLLVSGSLQVGYRLQGPRDEAAETLTSLSTWDPISNRT